MGNGFLIDLAEVSHGFTGHNLVSVDEAKPDCGHTPGFSEVGELITLPDVDGNLTPVIELTNYMRLSKEIFRRSR